MAQLVERVLGKDEVPGSNPGSSSKIPITYVIGIFTFILFFIKRWLQKHRICIIITLYYEYFHCL